MKDTFTLTMKEDYFKPNDTISLDSYVKDKSKVKISIWNRIKKFFGFKYEVTIKDAKVIGEPTQVEGGWEYKIELP